MKARVLTALEPHHEAAIVAHLTALGSYELVRRCPDLPDLIAAGSAGLADLALVSAGMRGLDRDSLAHLREAGIGVVGLVGALEEDERRLRQLGVLRTVSADCSADDLDRVLRSIPSMTQERGSGAQEGRWAALESRLDPYAAAASLDAGEPAGDPPTEDRPGEGRVVAVWGPTGAPGRTTLALNLAAELTLGGHRVLLIDADTYGASVGQHLGLLDEAPGLAAAARAAELGTLDLLVLARLAPSVEPGFRVLTGLPSAARWPEVRADSMAHILTLARSLADVVVVDCGFCLEDDEELSYDTRAPRRNAATLTVLRAADQVVAVGSGDPVGLQRLVRSVSELAAAVGCEPMVVVSRVRAAVAGTSPERRIGETLQRFSGLRVAHYIPDDRANFDRALLAGALLCDVAPKSAARARIRVLADDVAAAPVAAGVSARRGLGVRLRRLRRASPA